MESCWNEIHKYASSNSAIEIDDVSDTDLQKRDGQTNSNRQRNVKQFHCAYLSLWSVLIVQDSKQSLSSLNNEYLLMRRNSGNTE